ncbi:unnamed protein product [Citrullus colocynthis]|uniref:Uncharacterized protein n=1 Tax=Citrullus colocynthis TaxID=252529 RepID=A0ABP0XNU3_9ROSI
MVEVLILCRMVGSFGTLKKKRRAKACKRMSNQTVSLKMLLLEHHFCAKADHRLIPSNAINDVTVRF